MLNKRTVKPNVTRNFGSHHPYDPYDPYHHHKRSGNSKFDVRMVRIIRSKDFGTIQTFQEDHNIKTEP